MLSKPRTSSGLPSPHSRGWLAGLKELSTRKRKVRRWLGGCAQQVPASKRIAANERCVLMIVSKKASIPYQGRAEAERREKARLPPAGSAACRPPDDPLSATLPTGR